MRVPPTTNSERPLAPVPLPNGVTVTRAGARMDSGGDPYRSAGEVASDLVITQRCFSALTVGFFVGGLLAFFAGTWMFFALKRPGVLMFPVYLIPSIPGAALAYYGLVGLVSRSLITITPDVLTVKTRPLPWLAKKTVPKDTVEQLHVEQKVIPNHDTKTYNLYVNLRDGRKVLLVADLTSHEQACFLEQIIEERLGIVDEAIDGEHKP